MPGASHVITREQLRASNGEGGRPVWLAIKGVVYDVTEGSRFYGPGGAYAAFGGQECSRGLGKMSIKPEDLGDDLSDLTESQLNTLNNWIKRFNDKYPVLGVLAPEAGEGEGQGAAEAQGKAAAS